MSNPSTPLLPRGGHRNVIWYGAPLTLESRAIYPQAQGCGIAYTDVGQHSPPRGIKLDQNLMIEMITITQRSDYGRKNGADFF